MDGDPPRKSNGGDHANARTIVVAVIFSQRCTIEKCNVVVYQDREKGLVLGVVPVLFRYKIAEAQNEIERSMGLRSVIKRISRYILLKLIHNVGLPFLIRFRKPKPWYFSHEELRKFPEGTLGRDLAILLDRQG